MAGSYYEVEVRPNANGWSAALERQIGASMKAIAAQIRQQLGDAAKGAFDETGARLRAALDPAARAAADNLRDQLRRGVRDGLNGTPGNSNRQGQQSGRQYADAFSREVKAKLEAAFRALPDAPLSLNSSAADVELAEIRGKLQAAAKDIELGVDTSVVDARVAALQARLEALAAANPDIRVQVNTGAALTQIEAFRAALSGQGKKAADDFTDAFTRSTRAKLKAAAAALPDITIGANSTDVDRAIADIRAKLVTADNDIKIGVDSKVALAEMDRLRLRLIGLSRDADIKVRVNAGTALAELEALKRAASDDGKRGNVFTRMIADLRVANPLIDGAIGKLGAVGGAVSSIGGNNVVGILALITAIIAAVSTIGPLVAAASGALIGLAGVAGVAALAVLGLKKQMAEDTGFGAVISDQIKGIAQQAAGLGQVAANAVGPAIADVLAMVREALPGFQGLITLVGGRLGGAFRLVGQALLTVFQKASPLIVEVAGYIEQGAAALARWVAGPGFDKFLAYARQQLPIIIGYAKDFGKAIIDFFVALAPTGEGILKLFDVIVKGFDAVTGAFKFSGGGILGKLLGADDAAADADSASAQIDSLLASFNDLGSTATSVAEQAAPLDNYKKVIGDLVPALQLAAGNSGQFQVAVTGITDRLKAATPALATFMETAASFDVSSAKAADTAKLLGDALTASRGNALDYAAGMLAADTATQSVAKAIHDNSESIAKDGTLLGVSHLDAAGKFVDASNKYSEGSSAIVSAFQSQVKAATDAATATYQNELATKGQATAANDALTVYKGYRQSFIDSTVAAGTARDEAQKLADTYFAIPGDVDTFVKLLGQGDVTIAIQGLTDALNRLSDFIGAPKVELNKVDFDNSIAKANSDLDYFGQGSATPSIYANTEPFGVKMGQSNRALDEFNGRGVYATVSVNDEASGKIRTINSLIANLHDKTITINTVTGGQAVSAYGNIFSSVGRYAQGGIIDGLSAKLRAAVPHFAGGSENHVPQIALPGGTTRVWAEPETHGEAYIPFAMDRRPRAEAILADVAKRFGGRFVPQAASTPAAASGGGSGGGGLMGLAVTIDAGSVGTLTGHITAVSSSVVAGAAAQQQQRAAAGDANRGTVQ